MKGFFEKDLDKLFKEFLDFNELKLHAGIKIVLYRLSCLMSIYKQKKYENFNKNITRN